MNNFDGISIKLWFMSLILSSNRDVNDKSALVTAGFDLSSHLNGPNPEPDARGPNHGSEAGAPIHLWNVIHERSQYFIHLIIERSAFCAPVDSAGQSRVASLLNQALLRFIEARKCNAAKPLPATVSRLSRYWSNPHCRVLLIGLTSSFLCASKCLVGIMGGPRSLRLDLQFFLPASIGWE